MPKILLVEDEQVNREMFRRRLERKGYAVLTAESGLRAIELTKSDSPDLVLMDLGLPELDGWEATRRIKADPTTVAIPVIVLSAHATAAAKDKAFAAGCQEFETKPVNWDVLFKKIEAALAARKPEDEVNVGSNDDSRFGPETLLIEKLVLPPAATSVSGRTPTVREGVEQHKSDAQDSPSTPESTSPHPLPDSRGSLKELPTGIYIACPVQSKRILVVEDNDANRVMLCRRLNKNGFATTEARDGREALARVHDCRFDLMLLDIMMPEVDGYTVLRELKADPDLQALPVIMISAVDEMASIVKCIEMGAEDYLPKPYDPVLLQARINACLDKRRLRDQEMEYLKAVANLTQAASAVEKGEFDPAVLAPIAARTDALGTLARVFETMAREVRAREQKLNQELARLQVEVDRVKMTDQVKGIVDTAYFEQLEKKAAGLRSGRSGRIRGTTPGPDPSAETDVKMPPVSKE